MHKIHEKKMLSDNDITVSIKEVEEWSKSRTRCGVEELIEIPIQIPNKNYGLTSKVLVDHLHCPCSVCGHKYGLECEKENCQCCSSSCI